MADTLALLGVKILVLVALSSSAGADTPTQLVAVGVVWTTLLDPLATTDTSAQLAAEFEVPWAFLNVFTAADTLTQFVAENVVSSTLLDPFALANTSAHLVAVVKVRWASLNVFAATDALAFSPAPIVSWGTSVVVWAAVDTFALLGVKFLVIGTSTAITWFHIASSFSKLREIFMKHDTYCCSKSMLV